MSDKPRFTGGKLLLYDFDDVQKRDDLNDFNFTEPVNAFRNITSDLAEALWRTMLFDETTFTYRVPSVDHVGHIRSHGPIGIMNLPKRSKHP